MMVVAAANCSEAMALKKLLLPEMRRRITAAVDHFNGGDQIHIDGPFRRPTATHADFSGGRFWMVDGSDGSQTAGITKHRIHVGNLGRPDTIVDEAACAEDVRMPVKGCKFPGGNEQ